MSVTEIIQIDLPTIITLIVLWLLDYFKLRDLTKKMDEIRSRQGGR